MREGGWLGARCGSVGRWVSIGGGGGSRMRRRDGGRYREEGMRNAGGINEGVGAVGRREGEE